MPGFIRDKKRRAWFGGRLVRARYRRFATLLATLQLPLSILDVGGTAEFWAMNKFTSRQGAEVVIVNVEDVITNDPGFSFVKADATNMHMFGDRQFDVVFSNSVIEHLGSWECQKRMADEIMRVGQRYFVQTPNRYFPIEPHFVFPFFAQLPRPWRVWLASHLPLGWSARVLSRAEAERDVDEVRLLSKGEMLRLFPDGRYQSEKLLGLVKSHVVLGGWGQQGLA